MVREESARSEAPRESPDLPRTIWYMGAKARVLPEFLDGVLERLVPSRGKVLDLFSGTGIVSAWCARRYEVAANDVQLYAHAIARSLIERPPGGGRTFARSLDIERDLLPAFERNREALRRLWARPLRLEGEILGDLETAESRAALARAVAAYRDFLERPGGLYGGSGSGPVGAGGKRRSRGMDPIYRDPSKILSEASVRRYREDPVRRPACLATAYYGNVYYGLGQAIDIDSLRAAIDGLEGKGALRDRKRIHYLSALIHTASVATSGTSHFAQPRQLRKDSEILAMARRRRIHVLETFRRFSDEISGYLASSDLHRKNLALCADYRALIAEGSRGPEWRPEVRADLVYMDPPYTADNYSRFYHVLEALARYDYPPLERNGRGEATAGRYQEISRRFQSDFCRARTVEGEFRRVIQATANSGSKLVISYGSPSGLLLKVFRKSCRRRDPVLLLEDLCRERFRAVETLRRRLLHSGQGDKNTTTDELLVVCEGPR